MPNDRFHKAWRGYEVEAVDKELERLQGTIDSLRLLADNMPLAASPTVIEPPDPEGEIQAARWEAEKIRLDAKTDAHDIVQTAKFRREMIVRTAEEQAKNLVADARAQVTDADAPAARQLVIDLRPQTAQAT
ncbi:MAG: DivIVA domain-containing protein [Acidimicrobiia bacterium]|nr:DivIVA domain-containing protein [Acidimicrobiia bacterium]NNC74205.1 hypothetical protein [Acidimicrobiia bacterium]